MYFCIRITSFVPEINENLPRGQNVLNQTNSESAEKFVRSSLKQWILYHGQVIQFSRYFEKIYSKILSGQYWYIVINMCGLLYSSASVSFSISCLKGRKRRSQCHCWTEKSRSQQIECRSTLLFSRFTQY